MILVNFEDKIKGDSSIKDHEDWITVDSFSMGVSRSINASGSGKDRDTSTPMFGDVQLSKSADIASTELFAQASYGDKICDKAEVHFVQTGGENAGQIYAIWELYEPLISSYTCDSSGERPLESISISFTKILQKYTQFEGAEKQTPADPKGYDLVNGEAFSG